MLFRSVVRLTLFETPIHKIVVISADRSHEDGKALPCVAYIPQLGNMNLEGGTAPQTQQDFITLENHIGKPAKGTFEGTGDATAASLATSPMASLFRYATQEDHDPLDWVNPSDTSQWTADDYDMIRKEGVDPQYFSFVQDYAKGKRDRKSTRLNSSH